MFAGAAVMGALGGIGGNHLAKNSGVEELHQKCYPCHIVKLAKSLKQEATIAIVIVSVILLITYSAYTLRKQILQNRPKNRNGKTKN